MIMFIQITSINESVYYMILVYLVFNDLNWNITIHDYH